MRYNGYTNQATWNTALWITNDESTYYYFQQMVDTLDDQPLFDEIRCFIEALNTSGRDTINADEVNYVEVVEAIQQES